jgi:hypothetical protein
VLVILLDEDLIDTSFRNLVFFYRDELMNIHKTGSYHDSLSNYIRQNLRKHGVLNVKKGGDTDQVYLTEKALCVLKQI